MSNDTKVTLRGPFTYAQMMELFAFIQRCQEANPAGLFYVSAENVPDGISSSASTSPANR